MRFVPRLFLLLLACVAFTGCSRTDTFDIAVRNDTAGPLTLALAKDGPPYEQTWASPEELAIESPRADERHAYLMLEPGKEGYVTLKGKFDRNTRGYLRAYRGDLQISEMNAIGPASTNRLDLLLRPGPNAFVIMDAGGRLTERRDASPSPRTPPAPATPASSAPAAAAPTAASPSPAVP
jgi:hypothetical protein